MTVRNILLLASHAVAEHDDLRMFADLGYDVFAPGGFETPSDPAENVRPPVDAPDHPEFRALCREVRERHGSRNLDYAIDWAKADVHPIILDWADVVIVHHYPERWVPPLVNQAKRIIWRTCGQSNPYLELQMRRYRDHMEIVRYSPKETALGPSFAGQDAMIRFGKYPADYGPWDGEWETVLNIAQHDKVPHQRDPWLNWRFLEDATQGLHRMIVGPNSDLIGGEGSLEYSWMLRCLQMCRAYLYTGTQPASYTLALIEAMLAGIPVVSIGPRWMESPDLFEGHEIAKVYYDDPAAAGRFLRTLLDDRDHAAMIGHDQRQRAIELFDVATVGQQWQTYLR